MTPYFKYTQEQRESLQKQHPEWKPTDITKQTAIDWKQATASFKEKYSIEYKKELEGYFHRYAKYLSELTDEQKAAIKQHKEGVAESKDKRLMRQTVKELNKPKKPLSAIMTFALEKSKSDNIPYKDFMKVAKIHYDSLPCAAKDKYEENAAQARALYNKDLEEWEEKMIKSGYTTFVRQKTLQEMSKPTKTKSTKDPKVE